MKAKTNKQFLHIAGQPVLTRTLLTLAKNVDEVIVVARPGEQDLCRAILPDVGQYRIVTGGAERRHSVYNGLKVAQGDYVLVHDGSRPLVSSDLIKKVVAAAKIHGAAIPAIPLVDTVKEVAAGVVVKTLERQHLRAVQTPQVFQRQLLLSAHDYGQQNSVAATDDASLVEATGHSVAVVEGEVQNIKITNPHDIARANKILGHQGNIRVGWGYDVHQLVDNRDLILGGVNIPHAQGLAGHSDADVLTHAVVDALLGAAALGDIGRLFPDTDPAWAGADSLELLGIVADKLTAQRFFPMNIDATLAAERPKLRRYISEMETNIARVLNLGAGVVNVKATTTETLGFVGRGEGIAAHCVCTILQQEVGV